VPIPSEETLAVQQPHRTLSFNEAAAELRRLGIAGPHLYLLDAIPLLEMMWADGRAEQVESDLVASFLRDHVDRLNQLAGAEVISHRDASEFLRRFATRRPEPELLELLGALVPEISFRSSDPQANRARRQAILDFCLQIGAACTPLSSPEARSHFESAERECFWRIVRELELDDIAGS
jgi:hypothetical protein